MTPEEHTELLRIVSLAAKTNHLVTAMQIPVDQAFDCATVSETLLAQRTAQ